MGINKKVLGIICLVLFVLVFIGIYLYMKQPNQEETVIVEPETPFEPTQTTENISSVEQYLTAKKLINIGEQQVVERQMQTLTPLIPITKVGQKSFKLDCNGKTDYLTDIEMYNDSYNIYDLKFKCKSGLEYNIPFSAIPSDIQPQKASNIQGFDRIKIHNDVWGRKNQIDRIDIFGKNQSDIKWGFNLIYGEELNCPEGSNITGIEGNYGDDNVINQLLSITCKEKPTEYIQLT